jgi:hypothetical protein
MTLEERCNLVLSVARVLYVNGQATDQTLATAERLSNCLECRTGGRGRQAAASLRTTAR